MTSYTSSLLFLPKPEEEFIPFGHSVQSVAYKEFSNHHFRPYMEDGHKIVDCFLSNPNQGYFAIFDGHGGKESALYCKENFHVELASNLALYPDSVPTAMKETFESIDTQLYECGHSQVGTTATICMVRSENRQRVLYAANVGDSSAVLVSDTKVEQLTYDHKATDKAEMMRVQSAGGSIYRGRLRGTLALTRSLGDHCLKEHGLSAEPTIVRKVLTPNDMMLVVASDGIWDVVSPMDLKAYKGFSADDAAAELIRYAVKCGSQDNISVIVAIL
jgi:protein phosphatase PTC1